MMELVCKVCFALCFIALSTSIWTVWQRPDLWMDLNVEFKEFDSQWDFNNQPMDMHIRNNDDKKAIKAQNVEQLASKKRLFDIKYIKDLNSDPLPEQSFFGTINPVGICKGKDANRTQIQFSRMYNSQIHVNSSTSNSLFLVRRKKLSRCGSTNYTMDEQFTALCLLEPDNFLNNV